MSEPVHPSDLVDEPGAEPIDGPTGSGASNQATNPLGPLLTTETPADVTPGSVQREYEVSKGMGLILYATIQMSGKSGMPAVGNLLLGLFLELRNRDLDLGGAGDDGAGDDGAGGSIERV